MSENEKKKKLKIREIIIVEGRDDITAVKRVVDGHVIALNGFSGMNEKAISKLVELSKNNEMILLTDPDFAGKKIRQKIQKNVPNIKHAFVSRDSASKLKKKNSLKPKLNIGVENADDKAILDALKSAKKISTSEFDIKENGIFDKKEKFSMSDLIDNGLCIGNGAKEKRILLGDILKIGYYNSKQLLNALNSFNISREKFFEAMNEINKRKL